MNPSQVKSGVGSKVCAGCREAKMLDSFGSNRSTKDGLQRYCRPCQRESNRRFREANREKRAAQARDYYRRNSGHVKAYQKSYAAEHQEKVAARRRRYREANREQILLKEAVKTQLRRQKMRQATRIPFTAEQLRQRLSMWGGRCWMCRQPIAPGDRHIDHVKPLVKGGAHMLANLRSACSSCNLRKGDRWPWPTG
jgi:5-methylcytosine-specific restriction endonuclease McrA